jgi:lipopolysaccharide transport protein LptA
VNADELMMRQAQKVAHFSGNVKAWQERNTILSQELQVQGNGEVVTARGNVRTILYNTGAEARKTPTQSRSEQLVARRGDNRIDLTGKVDIQDEGRRLQAEKATLFLDQKRKIQRMEAENAVTLLEAATGRKGNGERIVYNVERKMVNLYGAPATISDPSGQFSGEELVFDLVRNRVNVVGKGEKTTGTYKHDG